MSESAYSKVSVTEKIKEVLHIAKPTDVGPAGGDRADPTLVHDHLKAARLEHERLEAEADANIHEREVQEAAEPPANPQDFQPPVVVNPRGPVSSLQPRNSLKHAAHGGKGPALPDLEGGTHIPEKELIPRHHESQHTALRPSNPYDVTAMDGAPDPRSTVAGDDMAI